jgi:hypothetical protein
LQTDQLVVLESTTYPGTTRERVVPPLEILTLLSALGADLRYHDPHVPHTPRLRPIEHPVGGGATRRRSSPPTPASTTTQSLKLKRARLIVDLRGITRGTLVENVVRL